MYNTYIHMYTYIHVWYTYIHVWYTYVCIHTHRSWHQDTGCIVCVRVCVCMLCVCVRVYIRKTYNIYTDRDIRTRAARPTSIRRRWCTCEQVKETFLGVQKDQVGRNKRSFLGVQKDQVGRNKRPISEYKKTNMGGIRGLFRSTKRPIWEE
jgi:hypothetical protein